MQVRVLTFEEYREWRGELDAPGARDLIADERTAPFVFWANSFMWVCPGCGRTYHGRLSDTPASGWDHPAWRKTTGPTLEPSLGCQGWRSGECPGGHYWLRDGELVDA
jgi:hypothetical protein